MSELPLELWTIIFGFLRGYTPVIRGVCRVWRDETKRLKLGSLTFIELGERGHQDLIGWAHGFGRWRINREVNDVARGAASGGFEAIVRLCRELGATDFDVAMANAARGGHEAIVRLCRTWGAIDVDWAMCWAALGGHEAVVCLCRGWGATDFFRATERAALANHHALAQLLRSWM